ncbi:UNVERIFIED_CONTAM: Phosphatidylinositol-3-phosphatase myotubularin-1 [Sesamum calycinum]|uniref:Phosphatidylinositol-3-phosphatase myotubularin-1 n=1 Tax=Sesamum calycinum TaxID=2727403 RepID=A0AAW2RRA8_9LAMI
MSMHRSRSGRTTSLRESESRLSESEKVEGAGSWDALEWTKVDPVSRSVPQGLQQFLLESEQLIVEAKELAEAKVMETTAAVESLTAELRNEKLSSVSARDWARRAKKESAAIKRAVQSLGCKVHFSEDGDCIVSIESNPTEIPQKSLFSVSEMQSGGYSEHDEKSDNSSSVTHAADDDSSDPISRVCESLCPLRTRDGGCRWPNAGCAQFESQFVGLKANYDAFDRLSIYDSYF